MLKKTLSLIIFHLIILNSTVASIAKNKSTLNYSILINNKKIGIAIVKNWQENSFIYTSTYSTFKINNVTTIIEETIQENLKYDPVKIVQKTIIQIDKKEQTEKTEVNFKKNRCFLTSGSYKRKFTINKKFRIGTNSFLDEMKKVKFKPGSVIKQYIYDPSLKEDNVFIVTDKIIGEKEINLNGNRKILFHSRLNYGNIKNIDNFFDKNGKIYKTVIKMGNMQLEMVLDEK